MASTTKTKKNSRKDTNGSVKKRDGSSKRTTPPIWANICDPAAEVSPQDFQAWASYLATRKRPAAPRKLFHDISTVPLSWGWPADLRANSDLFDLVRGTSKLNRKSGLSSDTILRDWLKPWLAERRPQIVDIDLGDALECLVWAYSAPRLATHIKGEIWRDLMRQLIRTVGDAKNASKQPTNGLAHLLVSGELPLVLAYQFPELTDCRELAKPGAKFVSQCLEQWLDGQGMPHANQLTNIRPLLATFTRSIRLAKEIESAKIRKSALAEFDWLVEQALRLTRIDLTTALTPVSESQCQATFSDMFRAALALTNDKCDRELLRAVLHSNAPKSHDPPRDRDLPDDPSYQSDWSECAVMINEWSPREPRLTVTHADRKLIGELTVGKDIVFSGDLMPSISINGVEARIVDDWECVCWFSDDDVDLLELRTNLTDGWKLERQFLMAREDQFLLMTDIMLGEREARIECCSSLPLGAGIRFDPSQETREGFLTGKRKLGLVLPLALPEWRADPRFGSLAESGDRLQLRHTVEGSALYAPLFIDFHRRRQRTTPTWRQLTVAEDLQIVPRDQAVGFRIHVGIEQWLLYRSLRPTTSRTLLGQHLTCEFLCSRFLNDGTIEPLVEIASDEPEPQAST